MKLTDMGADASKAIVRARNMPKPPVASSAPEPSLVERKKSLDKAVANATATGTANAKKRKRGILYGTGITKKLAAKAERAYERQQAVPSAAPAAEYDPDDIQRGEEELEAAMMADAVERDRKETPAPKLTVVGQLSDHVIPDNMMDQDIVLDEYQQRAMGLANQMCGCLIGAAGTGKTTVTKQLVNAIEQRVLRTLEVAREDPDEVNMLPMAFCSFTGKAVQQMKRSLPERYHPMCDTIHGTLGYHPEYEEYWDHEAGEYKTKMVFVPEYTAINKLNVKVCIVDEAGMCPIFLWNNLYAALPDDCQIIQVGDINQLPPVQGRSVLGFAMLEWPTHTLEKVHRTAEDSSIIFNAHRILQGKGPMAMAEREFYIQDAPDSGSQTMALTIAAIKHLHADDRFDPMQDALIVPQNGGSLGQETLNEHLVHYFNPVRKVDGIPVNPRINIKAGFNTVAFAVGDKVMLHQNIRDLGLTNGQMGVIQEITVNGDYRGQEVVDSLQVAHLAEFSLEAVAAHVDANGKTEEEKEDDDKQRQASHIVHVKFQNVEQPVPFATAGAFNNLSLAYAFTCHKSQGSEFRTVVVVCHSANMRMLCREWLYTAVTRAKERVIIIRNRRGLQSAVNVQRIKGKTVAEKARAFLALQGKEDTDLPNLPVPQEIAIPQEIA